MYAHVCVYCYKMNGNLMGDLYECLEKTCCAWQWQVIE